LRFYKQNTFEKLSLILTIQESIAVYLKPNLLDKMKRILFFIFILTLVNQLLTAQSRKVFEKTFTENVKLKFKPEYETASLPNYFIDEIAKALPKIRMYVKINYQYEMHAKVSKKGGKYLLKLKVGQIKHGGYFKYKGFDFSHLIAPARIEQSFLVKDLSSNTKHIQKVKINFHVNDSATSYIDGLKGVITYRILLIPNGVRYYYEKNQKIKFQEAVKNIDNYYDDNLKLEAIKKRLDALKYDEVGLVALRNVDLKYIEKDLAKIQIENYRKSLNIDSYDPIRLLQKYQTIIDLVQQKRNDMNQKMGNLDQINYTQALQELQAGNEQEAILLFKKSIDINPYFSPSIYQLSLIDYQHKRYTNSFSKLHHLLNDLKPNSDTKSQSITLGKKAYNSLMKECFEMNQDERFNQSIGLLEKAKFFCDSTKYIQCDYRLEQYISQATYGLYASYLSIANASLQKGRLDMCQDYMKMAKTYREQNTNRLKGHDPKAQKIMLALIEGLINQSAYANNEGDYDQASFLLSQARSLCEENPEIACKSIINKKEAILYQSKYNALIRKSIYFSKHYQAQKSKEYLSLAMTYQQIHSDYIPTSIGTDTIVGKVRYMMYQETIKNGKIDLEQNHYQFALSAFNKAKELETEYNLQKDNQLSTYIQKAAKPHILGVLEKAKLKAWGKYYTDAEHLLDSAIMLSQRYKLTQDDDIKSALSEVNKSLKKNICDILNTQYNVLIKKANASLRFDDYHNAAIYWRKAQLLRTKNTNCNLNTSIADAQLNKYQEDIIFSNELFLADSLANINSSNAFAHLATAENIRQHQARKLHSKKIKSMLDFLFEKNIATLNEMGISYYLNNKEAERALKLCKFALESGQTVKAELITQTAQLVAAYDKQKGLKLKTMSTKRFLDKKEWKELKKSYLRAAKK